MGVSIDAYTPLRIFGSYCTPVLGRRLLSISSSDVNARGWYPFDSSSSVFSELRTFITSSKKKLYLRDLSSVIHLASALLFVPDNVHFLYFVLETTKPGVHLFGCGRVEEPRTIRLLQDWVRVRTAVFSAFFMRFFMSSIVESVDHDGHPREKGRVAALYVFA